MRSLLFLILIILSIAFELKSQPDLSYYLPENVTYDSTIPTPHSVIGHHVGEWHVTHDRLVSYMYALDKASDRISLEVAGYTHEDRPLLLLTITAPKNHQNLENIRVQHNQLADPQRSSALDTKNMPAVFYIGFSIHGNEASGVNAGLLVAYHLAAAMGPEIENYLNNTVILFDPCYNPDGMQRFSSWVNSRKSKITSADPLDTEHNEVWPGGRFNHYWFDLNRDWLVAQHPESQARVKNFQNWKPNVLTDHHEMGTNSSFFFQPGVPSRMHPLTPQKNYELTKKMGEYHAKALDELGSLYFTQEAFDDFYYGKGSSFPDVQGAIGILFEQASSRGHAQESGNGILRFPFTIRNQFVTALSSLKSVAALRVDLLNYQRQFYKDAVAEASKSASKGYVFGSKDAARAFQLSEVLLRQEVEVYRIKSTQTINGKMYDPATSYFVPINQRQYRLISGMFEKRLQFNDSLFYDISSWTLPLAFGVESDEVKAAPALGEKINLAKLSPGRLVGGKSQYAYVFESIGYYAPRSIYRLLSHGLRIKVATKSFYNADGKKFEHGSILLPLSDQDKTAEQIEFLVNEIISKDGIDVYAFHTGLDYQGTSLGSNSFLTLKKPEIAMLIGDGFSATDAGEIWHMLDTRFNIPLTLLPVDVFNRSSISRYNTIIIPPSAGAIQISENGREKLKSWVQNGGVIIGLESALNWLNTVGLGKFEMKKEKEKKDTLVRRPYGSIEAFAGAQETSGAIFNALVDLTHPLLYGYYNTNIPVFKSNNLFMEKAKTAYGNPIVLNSSSLISGYISKQNYSRLQNSSFAGVSVFGQGRVIGFTDNLCFRAFWLGTNKIMTNAIFYGSLINAASAR
ncbi:MAG TPA: M14 metallopeptidase family protein [Chryseolinea sp.]|nr:M14 metallopeptidase family protein [Chryseolinea sp.]